MRITCTIFVVFAVVQRCSAGIGVSSANAARIAEYLRLHGGGGVDGGTNGLPTDPGNGPPPLPIVSGEGPDTGTEEVGGLSPVDFEAAEQLPELEGDGIVAGGDDPMINSGKFEGDIDLRGKPIEAYVDEYHSDNPNLVGDIQRNAIRGEHYRWPNNEIPFIISSSFQSFEKAVIASAIDEYNKKTCIRWKPRTNERDYVYILEKSGCYSSVGKVGGMQELSLGTGCVTKGIAIHEMMHAVGFYHEQSRTDRDSYISIQWANIQSWANYNFARYGVEKIDALGTQYDYGSVMHYGKTAFGKEWDSITIVPKRSGVEIGQRKGLSENDAKKINLLYDCPNTGSGGGGTSDCINYNSFCDAWALGGHCRLNPSYMTRYCPRSCRICKSDNCYNTGQYCEYWKGEGYCRRSYTQYMAIHCKKSCDLC